MRIRSRERERIGSRDRQGQREGGRKERLEERKKYFTYSLSLDFLISLLTANDNFLIKLVSTNFNIFDGFTIYSS